MLIKIWPLDCIDYVLFMVSVCVTSVFQNVPGTVPDCVCICGFERSSSNLDRAPEMRDSVLLSSREKHIVTLPSIRLETWVLFSSLTLGTDWPFLGCSLWDSLATTANSPFFLKVAIFWTEKCQAVVKNDIFFVFLSRAWEYNKM